MKQITQFFLEAESPTLTFFLPEHDNAKFVLIEIATNTKQVTKI